MTTAANPSGGEMPPHSTSSGQAPPPMPVICDTCRAHGNAGQEGFAQITDILDFEPVPRRTQVNNWTAELQRAFIAALALTGSPKRAGKAIGRHEHGAEKLRDARGGRSFARAWDAALGIYRDREMARLADQMGELSNLSLEQAQKIDLKPGETLTDEEPGYNEYQETKARIRGKLLQARRMYLLSICNNKKKKEAWERLVGPVDWAKAMRLEAQDNEPYPVRMVKPDMLLTAEGGCMPGLVDTGRDKGAELLEALDEIRNTEKGDGPKVRRFFDDEGQGEGEETQDRAGDQDGGAEDDPDDRAPEEE